ncbi:hypothetical protein SYNPS1DRAFT_26602 [Syncephalis pseudoplumigaleata]|uniref:GAR domain-containing protein n=1 Tax=Syncephalis pseudoplumigaleata TaxID=1712513 RepID=A0A4P9Z573_9FUNG|nr:hypothetical protein SYNPS1DRAFT_26602 [Syncephalis pseudoplumigaleata]|eukprot:RKP27757.1 hypothetical protein SYNPS1DRAFT_26602 [Syncephalis pseudoplumigaleata]
MALAGPTPQLANILGARASLLMEENGGSGSSSSSSTEASSSRGSQSGTTVTALSASTMATSDTASVSSFVASARMKFESAIAASNGVAAGQPSPHTPSPTPPQPPLSTSSTGSRGRRQHKRTESQVMVSARALNELRAKFDTIGEAPARHETVSLADLMAKFRTGQEEVNLWLGATTVALASLEAGGLGSLEDLEGTAALVVSVNRFTLQMESLTSLGKDIRRRLQGEPDASIDADQVERDCASLERSWRELRERVSAARKMAVEIQERDEETERIFRALDADVTRSVGASSTSAATLDALEVRLVALETRVKDMAPADARIRERLEARVRSIRNTLKGARAAANRRHDTFTAVAGQLDDLLATLRMVATRCLGSLRDCEAHFKQAPAHAASGMTAEAKQRLSEFQAKRKHYTPAVEKLLQLLSASVMATKEASAASMAPRCQLATPEGSDDEADEANDREDLAAMRRYADVEQTWEQVQETMWDIDTLQQTLEEMETDAKTKLAAPDSDEDETHLYPELSVLASLSRGASPSHQSDGSHDNDNDNGGSSKQGARYARPKTPSRLKQPGFMSAQRPATSHDVRATAKPHLLAVPSPVPGARAVTAAGNHRSYTPDVPVRRAKTPSGGDAAGHRRNVTRAASPAPPGNTKARARLRHQPSAHQLRTTASERPQPARTVSPLPHSRTAPGRFLNATREARPASSMGRYTSAPSPVPAHTRRSSHGAAITRPSTSMGVRRGSAPKSPPLPVPRGVSGATAARLTASTAATARPASSMGRYGRATPTPAAIRRVEQPVARPVSSMGQHDLEKLMHSSEGTISRPAPSLLSATARYYAPGKNVSAERAATPLPPPTATNDDHDGREDVSPPTSHRSRASSHDAASEDGSMPGIAVTETSPQLRVRYIPDRKDLLDVRVAAIVNNAPIAVPVRRVNNGRYAFGGKVWFCKVETPAPPPKNGYGAGAVVGRTRDNVSVRVGGGWKDLEVVLMECAIAD